MLARHHHMPNGAAWCREQAARSLAPRHVLSVSEWADRHRELTSKQSGERGRWRTERTPYLREIMDCLSVNTRVTDVVVMKSSQVGVTESMINFLGYVIDHAPAPTMVLMPSLELRDAWKVQKLNPLLTDTPAVRDVLGGLRSRDAANRQDVIDFPGGVLFLAGGNSPNSYAQRSVRYLALDDLDRFPVEVGDEGDPIFLAKGRTKAFPRAKRLFVSTPTVKETSLIWREWERSDQRLWHMACPHCGVYRPMEFSETLAVPPWRGGKLHYSQEADAAWYVCGECGGMISEHQKPSMLAGGRWISTHPERTTRGYHLSALFAPIGLGPSWLDLARSHLAAARSTTTLRTFINTDLGLPYEEQGDSVEPVGLLARLEEYPEEIAGIVLRTAGVDVQKDRLELTVADWGPDEECWVDDHLILPGDTAQADVWAALEETLVELAVNCAAIDAGYNTSMVRAFVERRPWCAATKGVSGPYRALIEDQRTRTQRLRRKRKGVYIEPVGVDQGKALVYSRLRLPKAGPGYVHFPRQPAFDDEYFAQLTAEKLVTKMRGTRPYSEWVQIRPRNEALDCLLLALVAARLPLARYGMAKPAAGQPQPRRVRGSFVGRWKG